MRNIRETHVTDPANNTLRPLRFVIDPTVVPSSRPKIPRDSQDYSDLYGYYLAKLNREDNNFDADLTDFTFEDEGSWMCEKSMMELMNLRTYLTSALGYYMDASAEHSKNKKVMNLGSDPYFMPKVILEIALNKITFDGMYSKNLVYTMLKNFYTYNAKMVMSLENPDLSPEQKDADKIAYTAILQAIDIFFLRMGFDYFRVIASQAESIIRDINFDEKTLKTLSRNQGNYGFH